MAAALARVMDELAPATTLARVQREWPRVAGAALAHEAEPVAERDGTLTIACGSSVWAQEIELLSADLLERLNGAFGDPPPLRAMRVTVGAVGTPRAGTRPAP